MSDALLNLKQSGYIIVNGKPLAVGVVCNCDDPRLKLCPMHGSKPLSIEPPR